MGCPGFGQSGSFCFKHLSLMEIQESFLMPPKRSTLAQWKQRAPAGFAFSMRAWLLITHGSESPAFSRLPAKHQQYGTDVGFFRWTEPVRQAYESTVACALELGCAAIVFDTPPSFTPTPANRTHLQHFFETIARPEAIDLVWQPRGIWSTEEVEGLCRDLQLRPAADPIVAESWPAGPAAYLKLSGAQYTDGDLFELAEGIAAYQQSYCVFDGSSAGHDALRLVAMIRQVEGTD